MPGRQLGDKGDKLESFTASRPMPAKFLKVPSVEEKADVELAVRMLFKGGCCVPITEVGDRFRANSGS